MEWNYRFYEKLLYMHYKECKGRTVHPTDTSSEAEIDMMVVEWLKESNLWVASRSAFYE